jgi:hypothetical protein
MVKSMPSAHPENTNVDLTLSFVPMVAMEMWLPVMSAAVEWHAKIFGIVTDTQCEWLDFANRRLAAHMALSQHLGACRSFQQAGSVYAEFFQIAATDYRKRFGEIAKPDAQALGGTRHDIHLASTSVRLGQPGLDAAVGPR